MKVPCLKCGSPNTYSDGPEMACLMCGKRWPINGAKPIIVYKRSEEENMEAKKPSSGKVGACVNCGREKYIADKEGLCASCHHAVKGINKDSVAYSAALADAKKRLINNPSRRGTNTKKLSPESIKKVKKHVRALSIKHNGGDPDFAGAIAELTLSRDNLLLRADKLTQAIALISQ